jgi:hypothetical protein
MGQIEGDRPWPNLNLDEKEMDMLQKWLGEK